MNNYFLSSVALCLSLATSGCAFLFNGGKQDVNITAYPGNADIRNNNAFLGQGSVTASLDRSSSPNIVATANGYEDSHIFLKNKLNAAWAFWDIGTCVFPITLCIPVLVDAISGSWNGYDDHYAIKMEPTKPKATVAKEATPAIASPAPTFANPVIPSAVNPQQQIIIVK
jgi:hypothetical protein